MKKAVAILFSVLTLFSACKDTGDTDKTKAPEKREAKGGRVYGGTFKMSTTEKLHTLYPHKITDAYSYQVASQIFESLIKLNSKDLSIEPALAERWETNDNGKTWKFFIKKGVKFHDDPCFEDGKGREVTAEDVRYVVELICTPGENNLMFATTFQDRLVGANEYYSAAENGKPDFDIEGFKVIDDYTVQFELINPNSSFIYLFAHPALAVFPKEAVDKYGDKLAVGTGPFILPKENKIDSEKIILTRNDNYHKSDSLGNQLPFLDSIVVIVLDSKKEQLEEFKKGNVNIVDGLPSESIREIVEEQIAHFQNKPPKFILDRNPEMGTNYYVLNLTRPPFDDIKVRKAFNYAINRQKIVDEVLKGEAYGPGHHGIVPPSFSGYNINKIQGYSFDLPKAKKLLAEAGYPNGKNFPSVKLELNSGGYKNTSVAFEIQKQLMENLNINIDLEVVPFVQKLEDERFGRAEIFRTAWIADYPSPENFLFLFYGKSVPESLDEPSYPNVSRFKNPQFDELYEKGVLATNKGESYDYFMQAEKVLMEHAPFIVLWYNEDYKLIQSNVRNYHTNPMNIQDFSKVYFKQLEAEVTKKGQ